MRHSPSALRLIAVLVTMVATTAAQQGPKPPDLPDAPVAKQESSTPKRQNHFNTTIEVLERRSIFFPSIATSKGALSSKQKFELFADESVAPSRFLSSAAGAGISQARNSLSGYGQEAGGYGKRFGTSMATAAANNFFGTYLISSLLHHDPRYFPTLHGGAGHRIGYALSRIVVARADDGKNSANWAGRPFFAICELRRSRLDRNRVLRLRRRERRARPRDEPKGNRNAPVVLQWRRGAVAQMDRAAVS